MKTNTNKGILKILAANFLELFIGGLFFLVGLLVFYTQMAGSRSGLSLQGRPAQISGAILMSFGVYRIFQAIKKAVKGIRNTNV